jgi:putative transcriptional regulator
MRRFDGACLTPIRPLKPEEIKALHEREYVRQIVLANYLKSAQNVGARLKAAFWCLAQTIIAG